jgi:hypothetical protein
MRSISYIFIYYSLKRRFSKAIKYSLLFFISKALGVNLIYMGKPLTEIIKSEAYLLTI